MNRITLLEAWSHWLNGEHVDSFALWGLRIIWWGRLGKMAEFLAGATIVVEIIGPARLRAFGKSLRRESKKKPFGRLFNLPMFQTLLILCCFAALGYLTIRLLERFYHTSSIPHFLAIIPFVIALLFVMGLFKALAALTALADTSLKVVADALEHPALNKAIKFSALLLLLLGFHFDLLSS